MKVKIVVPNPNIKPIHIKHTAAVMTMCGGLAEAFVTSIPHLGAVFFVIGGCMAIYEPHLVHEVKLLEDDHA